MSLLNSLLDTTTLGGGIPPSFAGTIFANSADGDDSNSGETEFDPVETMPQAVTNVPADGLIYLMPGGSFSFSNITLTKNITIYSPTKVTITGQFTMGAVSPDPVTLTLVNVTLDNAGLGTPFYDSGVTASNPIIYVKNCTINWSSTGVTPLPAPGTPLFGFNQRRGSVFISEDCNGFVQGNDASTTGLRALVYKSGAAAMTTVIASNNITYIQSNSQLPVYSVYSIATGFSVTYSLNNKVNFNILANNITNLFEMGGANSSEFFCSNGNEYITNGNNFTPVTFNIFNLNNVSKPAVLTNFSCDYGLSTAFPLNGTAQKFNIGVCTQATDIIIADGVSVSPLDGTGPTITGSGTLAGNIYNGRFAPNLNWASIVTAPVSINVNADATIPLYTVPAGRSARILAVLTTVTTGITGAPNHAVGITPAFNGIVNTSPIPATPANTVTVANTMVTASPQFLVLPAGSVISAMITNTAGVTGVVSYQLRIELI